MFGHVLMLLKTALRVASPLFAVRAGPSGIPLVPPLPRPRHPTRPHLSSDPGPPRQLSFVTSATAYHPLALTLVTIVHPTMMLPFPRRWPNVTLVTTRHALVATMSQPLTPLLLNSSMKGLKSFMIAHFVRAVLATAHAKRVSLDTALNRTRLTIPLAKPLACPPPALRSIMRIRQNPEKPH